MKHMLKIFFSVVAFLSVVTIQAASTPTKSGDEVMDSEFLAELEDLKRSVRERPVSFQDCHSYCFIRNFGGRPVRFNLARPTVPSELGKVHRYDQESCYGNFSTAPGYERTFRSSKSDTHGDCDKESVEDFLRG